MSNKTRPIITVPVLTPPTRVPVLTPPVPRVAPAPPTPPAPLTPFALSSRYAPSGADPSAATAPLPEAPSRTRATPARPYDAGTLPPSRFLTPAAMAAAASAPPPAEPAPAEVQVSLPTPAAPSAPITSAPSTPTWRGAATRSPAPPVSTPPPSWGLFPPLPGPASGSAVALPSRSRSAAPVGTLVLPRPAPLARTMPLPARPIRWWVRAPLRVARWILLLSAGALCCLGWLVATYAAVAGTLPGVEIVVAHAALIVLPPLMIVLLGGLLGNGFRSRLPLVLLALLVGVLPALLIPPPGALTPGWLARAPLLIPGFSMGVAIGFGWPPPRGRSPRSSAWGAGLRAAGVAAVGFGVPILALIAFEAYASFTSVKICSILTCYTQYLNVAYLELAALFAAIFGPLLALVGGAFGALLRGE